MKIKIKTSEICMIVDNPNYLHGSTSNEDNRKAFITHVKEIITATANETIKIKNR